MSNLALDHRNVRRIKIPSITPPAGRKHFGASPDDGRSKLGFNPTGIWQNFVLPLPFRRRSKSKESPSRQRNEGNMRPRELIELSSFGVVELEPIEHGIGHHFQPAQLRNPTWCDRCGDFVWGLYKSEQCFRCIHCYYTCHRQCLELVTLDCKGIGDIQTTDVDEILEEVSTNSSIKDKEDKSDITSLFDDCFEEEELRQRINKYNNHVQNLEMTMQENGKVFNGFIRVCLNLTRPINVVAGTRPPSIYDILKEEEESGRKTLTSFYLPRDTVKALHITSEYTTREVICALLKKFKVADNPHKFALYEQYNDVETKKGKMRRIHDHEKPLVLALMWCGENKQFVLQENETEDIVWEAFALAELSNFLKILDREEEEYLNQVRNKYHILHKKLQEAIEKKKPMQC